MKTVSKYRVQWTAAGVHRRGVPPSADSAVPC